MPKVVSMLGVGAAIVLAGCAPPAARRATGSPGTQQPPAATASQGSGGLHNVIAVTERLVSGSGPRDDGAFDAIASMGIRTIISVDGVAPEVQKARARGMRYIHLPVGYHGIGAQRQRELAKAVLEAEGPVYLHCHHGKHRGPAAAAAAAVLLGEMTPEEGLALLEKAGTAPTYPGLYACVRGGSEVDREVLRSTPVSFVEVAPTPGYIQAMAEAQERYDHLAEVRDAGWRTPPDHPDLVPLAEASRLESLMRALTEDHEVAKHPPDFGALMRASAARCRELEDGLAAAAPGEHLTARLRAVGDSCKACHVKYRDPQR